MHPNDHTAVQPVNYRVTIEPDMIHYRFAGRLELDLNAEKTSGTVRLNSLDLSITRCSLNTRDRAVPLAFQVDPMEETLTVFLPEPVSGPFELTIDYYGEISDKMAGLYKSTYRRGRETSVIAVTQFQESDARRVFPCYDQPMYKARFEFTVIVDKALSVIGNMPSASEHYRKNGKKEVVFQQTPPMSTYLLFIGIGDFRIMVDDLDRRVRAAILPGMEESVRYGIAFARKSLHYCEKLYGRPYPLPKVDLVAVPDFAFGAMENWGAITFRENLLLFDPDHTDAAGEERICEVIAHEMAHQWFGNLVTPSDWKYLWLNESFATYFGYGAIDYYHPDWAIWDNFIETQLETALNRDALTDTIPIEIPGGDHVVINNSTAPVIYSKGGSILRQIIGFVGEAAFSEGLSRYIERHAFGCAESAHLWQALEETAEKPVSAIMEKWVLQAGHPMVSASRRGDTLLLEQRRFSFLPGDINDAVWPIPMLIRLYGENGEQTVLARTFDQKKTEIKLEPGTRAYTINDRFTGFYRSRYADDANRDNLLAMARSGLLPPADRYGLLSDRFALTMAGDIRPSGFLDDLDHLEDETDPLPLTFILDQLFLLWLLQVDDGADDGMVDGAGAGPGNRTDEPQKHRHLMDPGGRLAAWIAGLSGRFGFLPGKSDGHGMLRLKNKMLWYGVPVNAASARQVGAEQFDRILSGHGVSPDIALAALQAGAYLDSERAFDWFAYRLEAADSEQERQNAARAMGCFSQPDMTARALAVILTEIPQRNMHLPVAWMAANPRARGLLWDWFTRNTDRLEQIHPLIFERIIVSITPMGSPMVPVDSEDEIRDFLRSFAAGRPLLQPAIRMSLEKRDVYKRLREALRE